MLWFDGLNGTSYCILADAPQWQLVRFSNGTIAYCENGRRICDKQQGKRGYEGHKFQTAGSFKRRKATAERAYDPAVEQRRSLDPDAEFISPMAGSDGRVSGDHAHDSRRNAA